MIKVINSSDLDCVFDKTLNYGGTYSKDLLPKLKNKFYVINMQDSDYPGGNGSHWVMCYNVNATTCEYFDPFGAPPPQAILKRMTQTKKHVVYSNRQIQDIDSVRCGYWVIECIQKREAGMSLKNFLKSFSDNTKTNEKENVEYSQQHHVIGGGGLWKT